MAQQTYNNELPEDSVSKKFIGVVGDDGGQETYALRGLNVTTIDSDKVWDLATASGDGEHATVGAKADAAETDGTQTDSLMAFLKGLVSLQPGTGKFTTATHSTVSVAVASGAALAANANRLCALLQNISDEDIFIKFNMAAVADAGIMIPANGGYYEMSARAGNLHALVINAIHGGSGSKTLLVTEGT